MKYIVKNIVLWVGVALVLYTTNVIGKRIHIDSVKDVIEYFKAIKE